MKILWDYIKNLYQYSPQKLFKNLLFMILDGFTGGMSILMLIPLLSITGITGQESASIPLWGYVSRLFKGYNNSILLIIILFLYVLLITIQALISQRLAVLNTDLIQSYTKHLRVSLFDSLVKAEWSCFIGKKKSDITNAFTNEITRIASGTVFFLKIIAQSVIAVCQLTVAFIMSVPLTCFVILCGAVILIFMRTIFQKSENLGGKLRIINQELVSHITEQLNSVKEVKSYGIEDMQIAYFADIAEKTKRNLKEFTALQSKASMCYKIGAAVVISLLFYVASVFLKIDPAALLIIIYIFAKLWPIFSSFQNNLQNLLAMLPSYASLQRTLEELNIHVEKVEEDGISLVSTIVTNHIKFENISFQYDNGNEFVLHKLNFEIPAKKITAFVGKSGSGKSTIIDLLLGLLKPGAGHIKADERIINEKCLGEWRRSIGYVPQDPFLFNSTIRENLLRFCPGVSERQIENALILADAYDFVNKLPKGLLTIVGDNGVRLSGGEKQRIVLARALLREPEILVLDEATSSLDNESEYKIQKAVESLSGKLTVVIIAHRLSTIRNADNIIVIDEGKVAEQGTFEELMKKEQGYFNKMITISEKYK